jgi:hypothetical protein
MQRKTVDHHVLLSCSRKQLSPVTRTTTASASRNTSIKRGLDFIDRVVSKAEGFASYGSLAICCFALVSATSRDANLRQLARSRAQRLVQRWRCVHPDVPSDINADQLLEFIFVAYALSRLNLRDVSLNEQLRAAAGRFSVYDLLGFNPASEPPANDLPFPCACGLKNRRGRRFCKQCRKRLKIQSYYRVWMEALANTYVSESCGVLFGARYVDVLQWLPTLRPYPTGGEDPESLREAIYAATHVVYTLNDYGSYRLRPGWLQQEFSFLRRNITGACQRGDPEILGELLDSLKAFGLRANHPLIIRGTGYLLAEQNEDGSWGNPEEENIRTRCHTTWTAIDGLRSFAWRGERLSRPGVKSRLK